MKKLLIFTFSIIIISGCYNSENRNRKSIQSEKSTNTYENDEPFKSNINNIVGDWFQPATNRNPEYFNKIFLDGPYWTFFSDYSVIKYNPLTTYMDKKIGTFRIDSINNEIIIDIPDWKNKPFIWKHISDGKSKYINLDDIFIKKGSREWKKFKKIYVGNTTIIDIDADELKKGGHYKLSKQTPMMETNTPINPIKSILETIYLNKNTIIIIKDRQTIENNLWYFVSVKSEINQSEISGWVNSISLLGQNIKKMN